MRELCRKEIENLTTNPMQAFGRDWMALAAGGRGRGLIDFNDPERDYHEMYIGEIVKVLVP